MNQKNIKKHTLYFMGGLATLLLLWVSFGGKGDATLVEYVADSTLQTPPTVGPEAPAPVSGPRREYIRRNRAPENFWHVHSLPG